MANREVRRSLEEGRSAKRGTYHKYDPETRASMGRYACTNGLSAAARYYSRVLGHKVSITTLVSIKKSYVEEKKRRDRTVPVVELPEKRRGRPLLLGDINQKVRQYLTKARESGCSINTRIVISAARGLVMHYDPGLLQENGGHIGLSRNWALSLLERMNCVKRKGSTSKSKDTSAQFIE